MKQDQRGLALVVGFIFIFVLVVFIIISVGSNVLKRQTNDMAPGEATHKLLRGVALTPREFTATGFTDFYDQAEKLGTSVSWHGDWAELADSSKAPFGTVKTARARELEPIILVGTHRETNGKAVATRPLSDQTLADYKRWAVAFTKKYQPRYFGMGNEVNSVAATAPADFEKLVSLFNDTTTEIKLVSPKTKVFVTFQLERLKGLNGGLFGGRNDPALQQWDLLQRFNADVLAFTTYPGLIYHSPSEIPADYYSEVVAKTAKPIAFSEVGWPASDVAAGWSSNPDLQQQFAALFLDKTKTMDLEFAVWLLLYDQATGPAFRSMGLIDDAGNPRPAFDAWKVK